jgi:hypothetical protein
MPPTRITTEAQRGSSKWPCNHREELWRQVYFTLSPQHPEQEGVWKTAHFSGRRQVPSFALLEFGLRSGTRVEANNAKGGS